MKIVNSQPTKRYYANGQQLALHTNNALYYTLNDPTGTSVNYATANGEDAGRILYDGYGGVLTRTVPVTLTASLGSFPEADTGLVYLGGGRFYDPPVGRPLQPNSVGGPPMVPQALNRYAATSVGQVGVGEGAYSNLFFQNWWRNNWYRQATSANFAGITNLISRIRVPGELQPIPGFKFRIHARIGAKTFISNPQTLIAKDTYEDVVTGVVLTRNQIGRTFGRGFDEVRIIRMQERPLVENTFKKLLNKRVGRLAVNVGAAAIFDVSFEAIEFATSTGRWGNPYWTQDQKVNQAIIGNSVDLLIVAAIAWWEPPILMGVGVYFVGSIFWSYIQPIVRPADYVERRNLKPLMQTP